LSVPWLLVISRLYQWYKVGALESMLTGHLEQLGIPDMEKRENAAKRNYSCLCPASDQASGLIYRYQKLNITKGKKTLPRRKEKLNVTRSRRMFA